MFRRIVSTATVLLMALWAPAWAAAPSLKDAPRAQAAQQSSTLQLFNAVQARVLGYPQFTIFDSVQIRLDGGRVELTGKVTMPYKRAALEKRVATVPGVVSVTNRIDVLPVSQFDDELRFRIARAIYGNATFWGYGSRANPPIHVIVEHGRVTLEGVVNSDVDRVLARSIASSFPTFGPVTNDLKTAAEAKAELERL